MPTPAACTCTSSRAASFLGAGIWHPGSPALKRIRDALVARPRPGARPSRRRPTWRLNEGEPLKRAPAGYRRTIR